MAVTLPVDFEKKVKLPPPPNGAGYPYRISAKDLMLNFNALADQGLPDGNIIGDILEWDGTQWLPVQPEEGSGVPDGYSEITVSLCVAGVPTDYLILAKLA